MFYKLNNFIECALDDVDDPDRDQRLQLDRDQSQSGNFALTKKNKTLLMFIATCVFNVRLLHAVAFSKKLLWLDQINVITLKTQTYAVNSR